MHGISVSASPISKTGLILTTDVYLLLVAVVFQKLEGRGLDIWYLLGDSNAAQDHGGLTEAEKVGGVLTFFVLTGRHTG